MMRTDRRGELMEKRKIRADQVLRNIRSGMSDGELMGTYQLSPKGLQSLFNKLVQGGFIGLDELDQRMPTFMGTVFVSEVVARKRKPGVEGKADADRERQPTRSMSLSEVLTDIRTGLDDAGLMKKYGLSARGLQSVCDHLVFTGLMPQSELDQRFAPLDSTVDVHEPREHLENAEPVSPSQQSHGALWECPACGRPQAHEVEECPVCGVIVKKYLEKLARENLEKPTS
jgi:rubrerythrin